MAQMDVLSIVREKINKILPFCHALYIELRFGKRACQAKSIRGGCDDSWVDFCVSLSSRTIADIYTFLNIFEEVVGIYVLIDHY